MYSNMPVTLSTNGLFSTDELQLSVAGFFDAEVLVSCAAEQEVAISSLVSLHLARAPFLCSSLRL